MNQVEATPASTPPAGGGGKGVRGGLIALNAALLVILAAVTLAPASHAQKSAGGSRARGEYTMTAGKVTGATSHAVYVTDASNQEVLVLLWNTTTKGLDTIGYHDLHADAKAQPGR